MTIWAFVDYENTGTLEGLEFDTYQRIFVFCGPKNTRIKIGEASFSDFLSIEIVKLKTTGADNLDFHIAYYLGKFSETSDQNIEFHVISKDNGFNGLIKYIKDSGRICKKVQLPQRVVQKPVKHIALSPCAKLAVDRLKQIDGRKRPRKKEKLQNWIGSQCRALGTDINAQAILKELHDLGLVESTNSDIKYKLKC